MRNFAFPGYTKLVWTQSVMRARQPLRRGRKGLHRLATGGYGRWTRIVCCQAPVGVGLKRPPPSGDRWLRPVDPNRLLSGSRWGGVKKASTVWRQVATAGGPESSAARHPLGCHDGDRLEAYPTMATGWKPILRWRQAGRLSCDGDRLEGYPAMATGWKPIPRLW